jgi:hypothetical protein
MVSFRLPHVMVSFRVPHEPLAPLCVAGLCRAKYCNWNWNNVDLTVTFVIRVTCVQELQKIIESMGSLGSQLGNLKQAAAGAAAGGATGAGEHPFLSCCFSCSS